jgi:hypothetical protein
MFSFSWSSFLSLFLRWVAFTVSFLFFSTCPHRRFVARVSGSGGLETYPMWVSP